MNRKLHSPEFKEKAVRKLRERGMKLLMERWIALTTELSALRLVKQTD